MGSMVTIVNNIELYALNLIRDDHKNLQHTHTERQTVTPRDYAYANDLHCAAHFTMCTYIEMSG